MVTWGEVRAAIKEGRKAYYVDNGVSYEIMVVDAPVIQCEIMRLSMFTPDADPHLMTGYREGDTRDFVQNFKPTLLRSQLSVEDNDSPAAAA
jgi:hypothetical protein